MKLKWIFALVILLISAQAIPGGFSTGHGGVIWACIPNEGDPVVRKGILVDLQEAIGFGLELIEDPGGDPMAAYQTRKAWLEATLPELYSVLKSKMEYVETHISISPASLTSTNDFNPVFEPEPTECPKGKWNAVNIANFREEEQMVFIRKSLWESPNISALDKSALLFHEAIYYWMRSYFGVTNSDKARRVTGILFSKKSPEEMKALVTQVLGNYPTQGDGKYLCVMKNIDRNQAYVAYDQTPDDAQAMVQTRCFEDENPQGCRGYTLQCEEADVQTHHKCAAQNRATLNIYSGMGRSLLEAQFNAHMSCFIGTQAIDGKTQNCPEFAFMNCSELQPTRTNSK